jgi:hypothetical protein
MTEDGFYLPIERHLDLSLVAIEAVYYRLAWNNSQLSFNHLFTSIISVYEAGRNCVSGQDCQVFDLVPVSLAAHSGWRNVPGNPFTPQRLVLILLSYTCEKVTLFERKRTWWERSFGNI